MFGFIIIFRGIFNMQEKLFIQKGPLFFFQSKIANSF